MVLRGHVTAMHDLWPPADEVRAASYVFDLTQCSHYSHFNREIINPIKRYGYVGVGRKAMLALKTEVLEQVQPVTQS